MHQFWYGYVIPKYGEKLKLHCMDRVSVTGIGYKHCFIVYIKGGGICCL